MIEQIESLAIGLAPVIGLLNIEPDKYIGVSEDLKDVKMFEVRTGFKWLKNVSTLEGMKVKNVRGLLPEAIWDRYNVMGGFDEHREMKMLKEALTNLRIVIVNKDRPIIFRKTALQRYLKANAKK